MKNCSRQRYHARARIVKALAHPTRLLLLDALQKRDLCVCELSKLAAADQSTVSKHLALLKQVGIVEDRKEGAKTFYRLRCTCLDAFFKCLESTLRQKLRTEQAAIGR